MAVATILGAGAMSSALTTTALAAGNWDTSVLFRRNLDVRPREVGQPADGGGLADRAVEPVMVVLVDPAGEGVSANLLAGVEAAERPAVGHGPVEPFDLASQLVWGSAA